MKKYLENASTHWVHYSDYTWKKDTAGILYLTPAPDARPVIYRPLETAESLVLDALAIGRMCMGRKSDTDIQLAIHDYAVKYGLFGLMTALPTTAHFMDYEAVYLPKNRFIKAESMDTMAYLSLFFPFEKPEIAKRGVESLWNITDDREMIALAMTFGDQPTAVNMSFQRCYAERYDWLKSQFKDWTFILMTSLLYYTDYDRLSEDQRNIYRQAMSSFDGNAPTYHIALSDKPTIVWDFHSLLQGIQLMFSFMLADDENPLRICWNCTRVFVSRRKNQAFCGPECKNQYNVRKNREKE